MDTPTSTPRDVVQAILSPSGPPQIFTLNLSQFREVYQAIQQNVESKPVDIVLNSDWAMVQFSRLCNHRIRVTQNLPSNFLSRLVHKTVLTEEDFDFAIYSEFYGARTYLSLRSFLVEEISTNGFPLLLTMLISLIVFQSILGTTGKGVLEKVNELLLTATTLYLSVFLLFTVSQNVELVKDPFLFREGLTHRFFRVDQLLASLAVAVMCVSILNVILLNLSPPVSVSLLGRTFTLPDVSVIAPFLSAVGVTMLVDCFLALIQYYSRRVRYILEKDLTKRLLDEVMEERNRQRQN